jgi:uncharacterized protein
MVKAVLDTNIWVSSIIFGRRLASILDLWQTNHFTAYFSPATMHELHNELLDWGIKLGVQKEIADYLHLLNRRAIVVYPQHPFHQCADPDDNKFFEVALEARCDYLVSGDSKVLQVQPVPSLNIVSPRAFIQSFEQPNQ